MIVDDNQIEFRINEVVARVDELQKALQHNLNEQNRLKNEQTRLETEILLNKGKLVFGQEFLKKGIRGGKLEEIEEDPRAIRKREEANK